MPTVSTKPPASKLQSNVARYIDLQLQAIAPLKNASKVADEAGLPQRNLLSMIRSGQTKLPFERIAGLAHALGINEVHLFRLALDEYLPAVKNLLEETGQHTVTKNEQLLLTAWRESSKHMDPPVDHIEHDLRILGERALGAAKEMAFSRMRGATTPQRSKS